MFKSPDLNKAKRDVDALFNMVPTGDSAYFELSSHWAQYLCVRVSGFMEEAYEIIFTEYVENGASPKITKYAKRHISNGRKNPNTDKIRQMLCAFSLEWGNRFEEFAKREGRKDALDSVMNNRHLVAHGRRSEVTITQVKAYFDKCIEIMEWVETLLAE